LDASQAALFVADTNEAIRVLRPLCAERGLLQPRTLAIVSTSGDAAHALSSGAVDAIRQPFTHEELYLRIARLLPTEASSLQCGALTLDPSKQRVFVGGEPLRLRKAEYTLLRYLLIERPRVVPARDLLKGALGTCGDGGTVRYHICVLRRKLRAAGTNCLRTRRGYGYWLAD
jgi:two-component system OmpR family response regulator